MTIEREDLSGATTPVAPAGRPLSEREEDRLDAQVLAAARDRGFRLAVRCYRCGQWVVAAQSVALHLGPTCRRKLGVAENREAS